MGRLGTRSIRFLVGFLTSVCAAVAVHAASYDWCALGESLRPGSEFIQVRRVKLEVEGELLGHLAATFSEGIIRQRLWPNEVERVYVSPYKEEECGILGRHPDEIRLVVTSREMEEVRLDLRERNDVPSAVVGKLAGRAQLTQIPLPKPPANATRFNLIRVFFATNRNVTGQAESTKYFGTNDAENISWGSVDVSIPHVHVMGRLESPSILKLEWATDPKRHIALAPTLRTMSQEQWKQEVKARALALKRPGVLLFVHGYNVSFDEGARRAAQFAYDIAFTGPTVYFSWPSDGNLIPYIRDETNAIAAKDLIADVLQTLTRLESGLPVYVVAHSMGNRVMLHGLEALLHRDATAHRALKQVVLAAPDVGLREFKRIHKSLAGTLPRYTLYASNRDLPVQLSRWLHDDARIGNTGKDLAIFRGVDTVDASAVTKELFGLNHSYFGDSSSVLSDLFTLIHHGNPPDERHRLKGIDRPDGRYWMIAP